MNDQGKASERRGPGRRRVMFAATYCRAGTAFDVRVVSVSAAGATLVGIHLPPRNAHVELNRNGGKARGRIAWICNDRAGVQFEGSAQALTGLRPIATPRKPPAEVCRRPSLGPSE